MIQVLQEGQREKKRRGVTLCVNDQLLCMELCLGKDGSGLKGGQGQVML